jgi:hypothetical protein
MQTRGATSAAPPDVLETSVQLRDRDEMPSSSGIERTFERVVTDDARQIDDRLSGDVTANPRAAADPSSEV